jgi:MYXO-CTERM domain-containing protein
MQHPRLPLNPLLRGLLLLGATAGLGLPAQALTTSAGGSGWLSLDNGVSRTPVLFDLASTADARSATGAGEALTLNQGNPVAGAVGKASSFAAAGVVKASVEGLAFTAPINPNVPTVTHGTPRVWIETSAAFQDKVELKSDTLAPGTEASFRASFSIHAETNDPGHVGPVFGGYDNGLWGLQVIIGPYFYRENFPNGVFTTIGDRKIIDFGQNFTGRVGDVIDVSVSLRLAADNRAGYYTDTNGQLRTYGGRDQTVIDASNTLNIFVTPTTAGVQALGSSGHDYRFTTAVPEPGTAGLWLVGLAGLPLLRRQRARPVG